jgi:PAS domain S-box-containing protein
MRAVGSQRDITDRVYATRERNAIWHYSQDLICVLDADGRFVRVNPAWQHLLGWHAEDLLATSVRSLVHPDDLTLLSQGLVTIAGASRQRQIRLRLQAKDGRYTWMSWSCFPDEQNQAYFAIARDITEQIQIEAEYRQAQKMEAVGQLAGGVAHDFNNLLTIINGYGELLLKDPQLQPTDREHLLAITHAGDRAANLTRQLLAFSRKSVVVPKVIDVHTIVIDAGKMLTRLIDKNISLKVSLQAVHSHVSIDPGQLEQVLVNLVVNARDAMPSGGTITITSGDHLVHDVPFVEQVDEHFRRFVELSVHDSGRGIDPQHLSKIFEPFFTTKEVGCGTGLGLSMVYGIITQAGGDITVESDLGHGTVFRIFLPTVDAPKDILTETPMPTAPLKLGNILLAEDEESVRSITKIVLERHGFTVLEASTGQRAIELASEYQGPIHLLISDVMMPDTGGRLVAEEVRKLRPDIVVLYMSGFTNNTTLRQGVASQCEAFLQKPFTPTMLIDKVTSLFAANT